MLSDAELSNLTEKCNSVLERNRFKKETEIYGYNNSLCYKAIHTRYDLKTGRTKKLYLAIYNTGTLMIQGNFTKEFIQKLKEIINNEIKEHKQLDMFDSSNMV